MQFILSFVSQIMKQFSPFSLLLFSHIFSISIYCESFIGEMANDLHTFCFFFLSHRSTVGRIFGFAVFFIASGESVIIDSIALLKLAIWSNKMCQCTDHCTDCNSRPKKREKKIFKNCGTSQGVFNDVCLKFDLSFVFCGHEIIKCVCMSLPFQHDLFHILSFHVFPSSLFCCCCCSCLLNGSAFVTVQ